MKWLKTLWCAFFLSPAALFGIAYSMSIAALFIFVPAPVFVFWILATVASEVAPHLMIGALLVLVLSAFYWRQKQQAKFLPGVIACLAIFTFICGFVQTTAALDFAQAVGVKISFFDCLFFKSAKAHPKISFSTEKYGERSGHQLELDIYQPQKKRRDRPAIVVVHGGSWYGGRRSDFKQDDLWLADLGYTVFDLDYSLAQGNVHFPAPAEDIQLALAWIAAHSETYDIDSTKIGMLGRSAGGELALVSAYSRPADAPYKICCVVALYAPTDLLWDYDNPLSPDIIHAQDVIVRYLGAPPRSVPALCAKASPCNLVTEISPPTLLIHGGRDQIVNSLNSNMLHEQLLAHHITNRYLFFPWANHGFDWFFSGISSQLSRGAIERFLEENL